MTKLFQNLKTYILSKKQSSRQRDNVKSAVDGDDSEMQQEEYKNFDEVDLEGKTAKYKVNTKGEIHSLTGPALIFEDGSVYWWIEGRPVTFKEWIKKSKLDDKEKSLLILKYMKNDI